MPEELKSPDPALPGVKSVQAEAVTLEPPPTPSYEERVQPTTRTRSLSSTSRDPTVVPWCGEQMLAERCGFWGSDQTLGGIHHTCLTRHWEVGSAQFHLQAAWAIYRQKGLCQGVSGKDFSFSFSRCVLFAVTRGAIPNRFALSSNFWCGGRFLDVLEATWDDHTGTTWKTGSIAWCFVFMAVYSNWETLPSTLRKKDNRPASQP